MGENPQESFNDIYLLLSSDKTFLFLRQVGPNFGVMFHRDQKTLKCSPSPVQVSHECPYFSSLHQFLL